MPSADNNNNGGNMHERLLTLFKNSPKGPKADLSSYIRPKPVCPKPPPAARKFSLDEPIMEPSVVPGNLMNRKASGSQTLLELENILVPRQKINVIQIKNEMASMGRVACDLMRERTMLLSNNLLEKAKCQHMNGPHPSVESASKANISETQSSHTGDKPSQLQFLLKSVEKTKHQPNSNFSLSMTNASQSNIPESPVTGNKLSPFEFLMKPVDDTKHQTTNNPRPPVDNASKRNAPVQSPVTINKPSPFEFLMKPVDDTNHQTTNNPRPPVDNASKRNAPVQSPVTINKPSPFEFLMKPVDDTKHQTMNNPRPLVDNASKPNIPVQSPVTINKPSPFEFLMKPVDDTKHQTMNNPRPLVDNASKPNIPVQSPVTINKPSPFEFLMKPVDDTNHQTTNNPRPPVASQSNIPEIQSSATENKPFAFLLNPIEKDKHQSMHSPRPSVTNASRLNNPKTQSSATENKPSQLQFLLKPVEDTKHQVNDRPSVASQPKNCQPVQSPVTHGPNEMKFLQNFVEKIQSANKTASSANKQSGSSTAKSTNMKPENDTDERLPMDHRCSNLLRNLHPNRNFSTVGSALQQNATPKGGGKPISSDVELLAGLLKQQSNQASRSAVGGKISEQRDTSAFNLGMHTYQLIPDTENQLKLRQFMKSLGICDENQEPFCESSQQQSSRGTSPKPEFVSVYWDLENCSMVSGKKAGDAVKIIRDTLYKGLCEGEFMVYCDVRKEDPQVIKSLHEEGVGVVHVESSSQNVQLELKIGKRMMNFCSTQPGSLVILITGDSNYKSIIGQLKNRFKAKVCLVHPSDAKRDLIDHATESWRFEALLDTCPNKYYTFEEKKQTFACLATNIPTRPGYTEYNKIKSGFVRLFSKYNGEVRAYEPPMAIMTFREEELFKRATKRLHMEKLPLPQSVVCSKEPIHIYPLLPGWDSVPGLELSKVWNFIKDPPIELLAFKKRILQQQN